MDKSSDKESKKKHNTSTLIGINLETIIKLLAKKIKTFEQGIVIETLESNFLKTGPVALDSVLKAIGNVAFLQMVVFTYSLDRYIRDEEIRLRLLDEVVQQSSISGSKRSAPHKQSKGKF